MVLATSTVLAVEAGPDNPRKHYWLRNTGARVVEAGPMDTRLREIADAFGRGEYAQARQLAQALLDATDDATLRAEAAGFVVQSHLAEGDFGSARAAAERINDAESLARINWIEAEYKREVGRLQHIVATTKDPAEAARAQLLTARVHQFGGKRRGAAECYARIVFDYSELPDAAKAVEEMLDLYERAGGPEAAARACAWAVDSVPESPTVTTTAVSYLARLLHRDFPGILVEALTTVAEKHPRTGAERVACEELFRLYRQLGDFARARQQLERLLALTSNVDQRGEIEEALWDTDLAAAEAAVSIGRCREAAAQLSQLLANPRWHGDRTEAARWLGESYLALGAYQEALQAYEMGLGDEPFGQDRLDLLFKVGKCQYFLGRPEEAMATLRRVAELDQVGNLNAACREAIQEAAESLRGDGGSNW